jgi:hypothetical protein
MARGHPIDGSWDSFCPLACMALAAPRPRLANPFAITFAPAYKESMKMIGLVLPVLVLCVIGCSSPSRFASDPRAAVVGPAYLDYITEFPRDRSTELYYPAFTSGSVEPGVPPTMVSTGAGVPANVASLLIDIPQPKPDVKDSAGKGYPDLERTGIRLFTAAPTNQ